jgi:GAF domain-containing protein
MSTTKVKEVELLQRYLQTVKDLYWASQEIATADNLLYALNQLLYKVMSVVGAKDGSVSRLDEVTGELVFVLVHGELGRQLPDFRIKSGAGIAGWVVKNRQPIIVNNPHTDIRFSNIVDKEFDFFTNCIASAPIMQRGHIKGVVQLLNKHGDEFTEADVVLLLILGQVAAIVFEEIEKRRSADGSDEEDFLTPL